MDTAGKVEIVPLRSGKGVMLYLPGEGPRGKKTDEVKDRITIRASGGCTTSGILTSITRVRFPLGSLILAESFE